MVARAAALDFQTKGRLSRAAARITAVVGVTSFLALIGAAYRQADELRFTGDPIGDGVTMLLGTAWATPWWWAIGGSGVVIFGALVAGRSDRLGWSLIVLGLVPLVVFPGLTGHANAADTRLLALGLDAAHVAAAGTWIGTLGAIVLIGRPWLDRLVPAFSPIALVSVAALVVTGAAAGWRQVGSIDAYVGTPYGRVLLVKFALFGLVALIGARNWRRLTPRLGSPGGDTAMARSASLEFAIGQLVLLATAVLVRMSP